MNPQSVLRNAMAMKEEIVSHRRWLHSHAELAFHLPETTEYVKQQLLSMGYTPADCGKAGIVATISGPQPGRTFLLRADMDALPIREESEVEFASTNEAAHACGHDLHTAMLLGAAHLLKIHQKELCGTVKLMFQPAEEVLEGAKDMIAAGVLENPRPDAAMMIHVVAGIPLPAGTVIMSPPGAITPAADYFTIDIQGKGCHGSSPALGVDPIVAAAHVLLGLQNIHARELPADHRSVLTIGTFHAGAAANVIADSAVMEGTLRAYDEERREFIKKRLTQISEAAASAFRAEAMVRFTSGCPTLINDKLLYEFVGEKTRALLGEARVINTQGTGGSEDFAYLSHEIPTLMLSMAAGEPDKGYGFPQHHPKVKFDESCLPIGAAVLAGTALAWLEDQR